MTQGDVFNSKDGRQFVFETQSGSCSCNECVFNSMGSEGDALCAEAPACYDDEDDRGGHYILKPDETN